MIFTEDQTRSLKAFLVKILTPIADAEPDVLGDYVIALLKAEKSLAELKNVCITQLEDFLRDETTSFVNQLFITLASEYTTIPPPMQNSNDVTKNITPTKRYSERDESEGSDEENEERNFKRRQNRSHSPNLFLDNNGKNLNTFEVEIQNPISSSKESIRNREQDDGGEEDRNRDTGDDTSYRKRKPEEFFHPGRAARIANTDNYNQVAQSYPTRVYVPQSARGYLASGNDWNMPLGGQNGSSQYQGDRGRSNGYQRRGRSDYRSGRNYTSRQQRCHDYDEKGYCLRGDSCPYDHGTDRIVVDDMVPVNSNFEISGNTKSNQPFRHMYEYSNVQRQSTPPQEGYDPERATFEPNGINPTGDEIPEGVVLTTGIPPILPIPTRYGGFNNVEFKGRSGGYRGFGRGRGRADTGRFQGGPPNANGYRNPALVVENIPSEFCTMDQVLAFFGKYGNITNIQLSVVQSKALLQFSSYSEASSAFHSPEPIFGNRFVKVYWYKSDQDSVPNPLLAKPDLVPQNQETETKQIQPAQIQTSTLIPVSAVPNVEKKKEEEFERTKRQVEVQKQKQEIIAKLMKEQKELADLYEKNRQSMTPEQRKREKDKLMKTTEFLNKVIKDSLEAAKKVQMVVASSVSMKSSEELERIRLDRELDLIQKSESETEKKEIDPKLQAQLDALKNEALNLGIDPSTGQAISTTPTYFGAGRGRGRGAGFYQAPISAPRNLRLDNRTTKVLVKGMSESTEEFIKAHFE
ncbi:RNA-binding protein 27, partial [Nowakowskiella sp. JEL0078]